MATILSLIAKFHCCYLSLVSLGNSDSGYCEANDCFVSDADFSLGFSDFTPLRYNCSQVFPTLGLGCPAPSQPNGSADRTVAD